MHRQIKHKCATILFVGDFKRQERSGERRGFGSRGSDRTPPMMHQATCSSCGKECEVPFRPTGSKPVYCRDCFQKTGPESNRSEGRRFERSDSSDRQMFEAVCSNCGDNCKIPFQPREGRPVFCSRCFEKNESADSRGSDRPRFSTGGESTSGRENRNENRPSRTNDQPNYKAQFEALNAKMDKILALLTSTAPVVTETVPLDSELDENVIEELAQEVTMKKSKKVKAAAKSKGSASGGKKTVKKTTAPKKSKSK